MPKKPERRASLLPGLGFWLIVGLGFTLWMVYRALDPLVALDAPTVEGTVVEVNSTKRDTIAVEYTSLYWTIAGVFALIPLSALIALIIRTVIRHKV